MKVLPGQVSVITPVFNHAHFLRECVESVWNQESLPIEHVLIDDSSTDGSLALMNELAREYPQLRVIARPSRMGAIANFNLGMSQVQGEYAVYLSADDKLLPGYFLTAKRLLSEYPEAAMFLCSVRIFNNAGTMRRIQICPGSTEGFCPPSAVPKMLHDLWPHGQGVMKISALRDEGGYREDLRWHADWFASWAMCLRHGFCHAPIEGTALRHSDQSYSGRGRRGVHQRKVLRRIFDLLQTPAYQWMTLPLREANAFSHFGPAIVPTALFAPAGREFITADLVRALTWSLVWQSCRLCLPRAFRRWLYQTFIHGR